MPLKIRGRRLLTWLNGFAFIFPNEDSVLRAHPPRAIYAICHPSTGVRKREASAVTDVGVIPSAARNLALVLSLVVLFDAERDSSLRSE
jgi:hypothetical protein